VGLLSLGWDQRGYSVVEPDRDIAVFSRTSMEAVGLFGGLQPRGPLASALAPVCSWTRGRLSARQVSYSFAWNAGPLVRADR
jgi:hypothetical protein